MKTELSIWSQYYYELSPEEAVLEFLKNGIGAMELSDEHGAALLERDADVVATGKRFANFLRAHPTFRLYSVRQKYGIFGNATSI